MKVRFWFSQVDEWQTPVAPRRRVDRGYIPPSPRNISSFQTQGPASCLPSIHQLGNLANFMQRTLPQEPIGAPGNLVSAEGELRRLCLSQGWGGPTVHLTGQRIAASGFQVHKMPWYRPCGTCWGFAYHGNWHLTAIYSLSDWIFYSSSSSIN